MPLERTLKLVFALLLTVVLPMRGYAATVHCDPAHGGGLIHVPHRPPPCHEGGGALHVHGCGDCCGVAAIAFSPSPVPVPRAPAGPLYARPARLPPTLGLDRLDRPPRPAV